jgi:hypothetical protein
MIYYDPGDINLFDDIRTEYHPKSGRPPETVRFEDYREHPADLPQPAPSAIPVQPFESHADFEFAKAVTEASLNKKQIDSLIEIFHRCLNGGDKFNLKSAQNVRDTWERASCLLTPVSKRYD